MSSAAYMSSSDSHSDLTSSPKKRWIGDEQMAIPAYLEKYYWWAYVRPWAVKLFEREWLVNLILWGFYKPLYKEALAAWGPSIPGETLQISCCYGTLTPNLYKNVEASNGRLTIIDISAAQLDNVAKKVPDNDKVIILRKNSADLGLPDQSYDRALLFFLPHEQPRDVREKSFAEAFRVVKKGGSIVIVEFAKPVWWHPLRYIWHPILSVLEPFAPDIWKNDMSVFFPENMKSLPMEKKSIFGGFYQRLIVKC